ncbi:MAG: transcriptional regulator [Candidatus Odinarchaeota archaeon]|nr:transcriptional regulator [Candidatus Odinarchaeota archaeon]
MSNKDDSSEITFAVDDLLYSPARMNIMLLLYLHNQLTFNQLLDATKLTPGNLVTHLKKLEKRKYIRIVKFFDELKPRTKYVITQEGKKAFEDFTRQLSNFLEALKKHKNITQ